MTTKVDDIMYGIINSGGMQKIGEINKITGKIITTDIPKMTSMCNEHITDAHLLRDLLEYEIRKEPHDDMFMAVSKFLVQAFDMRMKRSTHKGRISPASSSETSKKEADKHV